MTEKKTTQKKFCIETDTLEDELFKLQCIFKSSDIQLSVQCETSKRQILAFTTENTDIIFYFQQKEPYATIVKRIPWFQSSHKQITALCFSPLGSWLLCASIDGTLYIVPVSPLVNETPVNGKWSTDDVTIFSSISFNIPLSRPTAINWYKDTMLALNIGIIGTECGEIILVNLDNGKQISVAYVNGVISSLVVYQDEINNSLCLLITCQAKQQWRLILQQHAYNCFSQLQAAQSYNTSSTDSIHDSTKLLTPTKSRLQGLKQLSVEKLAIFRQKLTETKNQDIWSNKSSNTASSNGSEQCSISNVVNLESLPANIFLMLHSDKFGQQQIHAQYHRTTSHITIYNSDISTKPVSVHKVFDSCENMLLTQRLFFITDNTQRSIYIVSDRLSEIHQNINSDFDSACIIGYFSFENSKESIRNIYITRDFSNSTIRQFSEDIESTYILPKKVKDVKIELPCIDTCIVVTNNSVYKIVLRKSLLSTFMELVLKKNKFDNAEKLALIFGMNAQQLLEYAGDILLSNKEFRRAVTSYKLSKCRLLKSVLKFASIGHTSELLSCLMHCLGSPAISDLPIATKIHLSNLCVLAFFEMSLRASAQESKVIYKDFLHFLSTNKFYDELLTVNIAGQTCLWEILHHLATQRGLYEQMLDILMKTMPVPNTNNYSLPCGMLICLSESNLMQVMLLNPDLARGHITFVNENLIHFQIFVMQRLITLYDPTSPILRPRLIRHAERHRATSNDSQSHRCDSLNFSDSAEDMDTLIEEIIECFLLILLTLIHKKSLLSLDSTFIYNVPSLKTRMENIALPTVDFKRRSLSAGFSHVALIRNSDIYTWGNSSYGCLGIGSSVLRYNTPHAMSFFRNMKLDVFSVSCGHCHTIAVTNNGVYAWGGSQYGQLGIGKVLQRSSPELIVSLAQEVIVDAVAGQYHSVALSADGRVFTWGWGVHGQLGHGNTEERNTPTLVTALLGTVICHISAGHAHTLVLSVEGVVYAFGCNVFGQLGLGNTMKSSIPMKVLLPEAVCLIASGYFHNLAISNTNKLYVWGASPQVLRLQAQAQKRSRILEQQDNERKLGITEENKINTKQETSENGAQSKSTPIKSNMTKAELQRKLSERASLKNINVGLLEEAQTHLKPTLVDTSFVKGQIIQISCGCHHNALLTKDGSLHTWGRNLDGQIGNGTKREEPIPTALRYDPIIAKIPIQKKIDEEQNECSNGASFMSDERNVNVNGDFKLNEQKSTGSDCRENPIIKAVGISCGYDYTVAIQPGGTILAWGNNSRAQLGRLSKKEGRDNDEKVLLPKSTKRIIRLAHTLDVPSQVPNISPAIIYCQNNDTRSFAGQIRPLSIIEKSPGVLTLHYILEYFHGLYDTVKIMKKCIQLENYQACAKIARLQCNISGAFSYELKRLSSLYYQLFKHKQDDDLTVEVLNQNLNRNTELFNKQIEKNLMECMENFEAKNKMKISASKSLNSLQSLEQELYSFDCQGGSEEPYKSSNFEDPTLDISEDPLDPTVEDSEEWIDNLADTDLPLDNETFVITTRNKVSLANTKKILNTKVTENKKTDNMSREEKEIMYSQKSNMMNETIRVIKFYLHEMEFESDEVKFTILQSAIIFWIKHNLSMQRLENVFLDHIQKVFYPLGLLLFCQETAEKYIDSNKNNAIEKVPVNIINFFSTQFCIQICSMLLQHIEEGQPMPEYIKLFSLLTADHYGPPLTGYPGSSGNNTSKQMLEGIISTISSESYNSKSFVHIKDPEAVYRFLALEEDKMIFTCGHHFPFSVYQSEVITGMETELLTCQSLLLPSTAQLLGKILSQTTKPEILCPACIPRALGTMAKQNKG